MYREDDLLPISALQHLIYCERQCALIHIERAWSENRFTAEGRIMHERVHSVDRESRGRVHIVYGLELRSFRLGIKGKADVVEFHYDKKPQKNSGQSELKPCAVKPVEYKLGRPKVDDCDKVQLCAQALCLEEMLDLEIVEGSLFYGKTRRRLHVLFNDELRRTSADAAKQLHELIVSGRTPPPANENKKCDKCSLIDLCIPKIVRNKRSVKRYLSGAISES